MADFNLDETTKGTKPDLKKVEATPIEKNAENIEVIDPNAPSAALGNTTQNKAVSGLTAAERGDVNRIKVTIADTKTPIVVLFGAQNSGKTMALIRLTRFLRAYTVSPVKSFRSSEDEIYAKLCEDYNHLIDRDDAADSTNIINFMLLKVSYKAKPVCQILEAPGEHYYDTKNRFEKTFPSYINEIIKNNNRKIWVFLVEPDWKDEADRKGYVEKIKNLKSRMKPHDKVIVLFNKIDTTDFLLDMGHINKKEAIKYVEGLYPGIFDLFKNQNPITKFFRKYNCEFVPFSSGEFSVAIDGKLAYTEGPEDYPKELWSNIMKCCGIKIGE